MDTKVVWPHLKVFCLAKTTLQGTVQEKRRGRQKRKWEDNIKSGQGVRAAEDRTSWKRIAVKSSVVQCSNDLTMLRDRLD